MIRQGDLYWVDLGMPRGSAPGYRRPVIVVQNNVFNISRLSTVLICPLTTNLRLGGMPGNVLMADGEAGIPKQSIVNVTQVATIEKAELGEYIGTVSPRRLREILNGIALVLEPREGE
jgi:mRNA interferase MazF